MTIIDGHSSRALRTDGIRNACRESHAAFPPFDQSHFITAKSHADRKDPILLNKAEGLRNRIIPPAKATEQVERLEGFEPLERFERKGSSVA